MRRVVLAVLLVAVGFGTLAADEPKTDDVRKKAANKVLESFAGTWEISSVKPAGVTKEARRLVFKKDWTYAAVDKDGKELWAGTFNLDPTATPKIWDHRSHEIKKKGGDALGIYELDRDSLKLCCVVGRWKDKVWTGKPRPKEFKLDGADVVIELRRVKTDRR
jgi:uncharacterized protein (TIGR03067 family)